MKKDAEVALREPGGRQGSYSRPTAGEMGSQCLRQCSDLEPCEQISAARGLSCGGLRKPTTAAGGKAALPFSPPIVGTFQLLAVAPLYWENISSDAPSSEQLSDHAGTGQEQGKGEMCWSRWCSCWKQTAVCPCALSCARDHGQAASKSFGRSVQEKLGW